jgi:hypothetical protein
MSKREHLTAEMIADYVVQFRNVDNDGEMRLRILRNVIILVMQERKAQVKEDRKAVQKMIDEVPVSGLIKFYLKRLKNRLK